VIVEESFMVRTIISGIFKAAVWSLAVIGVVGLVLVGMIAWPPRQPPEMASISDARKSVDFSSLPAIERFQARDGTALGFRHYPPVGPAKGRVAIVIHGSSGSSATTIHALSAALATRGVESYAIDIRGHGASGMRGDIGYVGQLEDDLADFVAVVRDTSPAAPLSLIGHSSGGGFALRVAASPIQGLFEQTVLLAPYLGYNAPSNWPNSGGWASPDIPRIIGLAVLRTVGIQCCESLPVLEFAVPPNSKKMLVSNYTDRLMRNFANHPDFRADIAAASKPLTIMAGADNELMLADQYPEAVRGAARPVHVKLIEGVNHMGIVNDPAAVSIVADYIATADPNS
jgi:alpha-beta hydrolase superfamily lysophospholipase